jgi:uncharacterized protein (DUF1330 family)
LKTSCRHSLPSRALHSSDVSSQDRQRRQFLDRIATHILAFEGDSHVEWFEGNFQDYEADKTRRLGVDAGAPDQVQEVRALGAPMRYLITANLDESGLPGGVTAIARGEAISLEQPWPFGRVLISRVEEGCETGVAKLEAVPNIVAFSVAGLAEPSDGAVCVFGAHIMKDPEGMKPYIEGVSPVIAPYGCTYLARSSTVSIHAGAFKPDRVAVMQFPTAAKVAAWYTSDAYAPLLAIRLRCTEAREVLVMADGAIPDDVRHMINSKVPGARVI